MYLSYGMAHGAWANPALIGVAAFVMACLPDYSRISNRIEQRAYDATVLVTAGRLARFGAQFLFNLALFVVLDLGQALSVEGMASVGGGLGAALAMTLASQGAQYIAIWLFQRNVGDINRNVMVALSANVVVTALGTAGLPVAREVFLYGGGAIGLAVLAVGVLSDLRGRFPARGGIAIFFGTFNPFHNTHLALIRRALDERGVAKVIVHPTVVPRMHVRALERGEMKIARTEAGYGIYETTEKADVNVDYFPTGRKFLAPETRRDLIRLAVDEAGLGDRVEVAFWPDLYAERGFQGVIAEIKKRHPGVPVHGIHGSDFGGMLVRAIMDECGWIYPMSVLRRDGVSATAIRAGAKGMTSDAVAKALGRVAAGLPAAIANDPAETEIVEGARHAVIR